MSTRTETLFPYTPPVRSPLAGGVGGGHATLMTLTPQWLDELRSRITLSTLIGRTVKITRAGSEYKACCPFHNEKTPSFTIRSEEHTSDIQSLMRNSYAVFCLQNNTIPTRLTNKQTS